MCATTLSHGIFWAQLVSQPSASPPAFSWAPKPLISQRLAASLLAVPNLAAVTAVLMLSWCIYHYIYLLYFYIIVIDCHWLSFYQHTLCIFISPFIAVFSTIPAGIYWLFGFLEQTLHQQEVKSSFTVLECFEVFWIFSKIYSTS